MLCCLLPVKYWSAAPKESSVHHPQVHLDAVLGDDGGFGRPVHQHPAHVREFYERIHHGFGLFGGRQDIDVLYRVLAPPDASRHFDVVHRSGILYSPDNVFGQRQRTAEWPALGAPFDEFDPLEDIFFRLLLDARQARKLSLPDRRFQFIDALDLEPLEQHLRLLRAQAGDREKLQHPTGDLPFQFLVFRDLSRFEKLVDLTGKVLADAGY